MLHSDANLPPTPPPFFRGTQLRGMIRAVHLFPLLRCCARQPPCANGEKNEQGNTKALTPRKGEHSFTLTCFTACFMFEAHAVTDAYDERSRGTTVILVLPVAAVMLLFAASPEPAASYEAITMVALADANAFAVSKP